MWLENNMAGTDGGGFMAYEGLRLKDASMTILGSTASGSGGGFLCRENLELTDSILSIKNGSAQGGGGFYLMPVTGGRVYARITGSKIDIESCNADLLGGGFFTGDSGAVSVTSSEVRLLNVTAGRRSGGFEVGPLNVSASKIRLERARAGKAGGFLSWGSIGLTQQSRLLLIAVTALHQGGGFHAEGSLEVMGGSEIDIAQAEVAEVGGICGGFITWEPVRVAEASTLRVNGSKAAKYGGAFCAVDVEVVGGSQLLISDSHAFTGHGGGIRAAGSLRIKDNSTVSFTKCSAATTGGGAFINHDLLIANGSSLSVFDSFTESESGSGGGVVVQRSLRVSRGSMIHLENTSAATGGGFNVYHDVEIDDWSSLSSWGGSATKFGGGAFRVQRTLQVTRHSRVIVKHPRAYPYGGGFHAVRVELSDSTLAISEAKADKAGGGFFVEERLSMLRSQVNVSAEAGDRGGGFFAASLMVVDSELHVSGLPGERAATVITTMGSGGFVQGPVHVVRSNLHFNELHGPSAMVAHCLELSQSALQVNAAADVGIALQNAACGCNTTLSVDGALSGRGVSSALLSLDGCADEALQISHVRFETKVAAVAKTRSHTLLNNITVEYLQPVTGETPILVSPSFQADAVEISCAPCDNGVTFHEENGLYAVSSSTLNCQRQASLVGGRTDVCDCKGQLVVDDDFRQQVDVAQTFEYCTYCLPQHEKRNGTCQKCPVHQVQRVAHLKCKKRGVILSS